MDTLDESKTNLIDSIRKLYGDEMSISEAETAKRYLVDFFKILETVDSRLKQREKFTSRGYKGNENYRNTN